jgi:hypothetical protein
MIGIELELFRSERSQCIYSGTVYENTSRHYHREIISVLLSRKRVPAESRGGGMCHGRGTWIDLAAETSTASAAAADKNEIDMVTVTVLLRSPYRWGRPAEKIVPC